MSFKQRPALLVLLMSTALFLSLYYRSISESAWAEYLGYWYGRVLVAPLEFLSLFLIPITLFVALFNSTIQEAWWRWAKWVLLVPVGLIVAMIPSAPGRSGFITIGGITELVTLWAIIFASATVLYVLSLRFSHKTGVRK